MHGTYKHIYSLKRKGTLHRFKGLLEENNYHHQILALALAPAGRVWNDWVRSVQQVPVPLHLCAGRNTHITVHFLPQIFQVILHPDLMTSRDADILIFPNTYKHLPNVFSGRSHSLLTICAFFPIWNNLFNFQALAAIVPFSTKLKSPLVHSLFYPNKIEKSLNTLR